MFKNETICAVATGMARSAIGIIRVSGPDAISICNDIFIGKKRISEMDSFTAAFGRIVEAEEGAENGTETGIKNGTLRTIDEAVVLVMKAPHTYTTEDTVEIDVHGGPYVIKRVLELLIKRGARLAEPGEFTKRAFLGGRIDMTEAEAVMDVISAETDRSLKTSVNQLTGKLKEEIVALREKILYQTAYIESALDDPEHYSLDGFSETLRPEVQEVMDRIDRMISTSDEGRIIREGIRTVIAGKPNVGKSSMLNSLLGEERAIVTEIEGTTRDTLEEYVDIGGVLLRLIDTAGIRETEDVVEKIGVDKAKESIEDADLVLMLLDATENISPEDEEIMNSLSGKNVIVINNKIDKISEIREDASKEFEDRIEQKFKDVGVKSSKTMYISAKTGEGIEELKALIRDMFLSSEIDYNDQIYITRSRHKASLADARQSLSTVIDGIDAGMGEDFLTIDLMAAYESLGEIIGEVLEDDLADKIFAEFCMGK